ncbi:MAG: hypothetical protein ABIS86_13620 [Streptosporangiaceae bacterium]
MPAPRAHAALSPVAAPSPSDLPPRRLVDRLMASLSPAELLIILVALGVPVALVLLAVFLISRRGA